MTQQPQRTDLGGRPFAFAQQLGRIPKMEVMTTKRIFASVLTRNDDFSVALDLQLNDSNTGTTPGKSGGFQTGVGACVAVFVHDGE